MLNEKKPDLFIQNFVNKTYPRIEEIYRETK